MDKRILAWLGSTSGAVLVGGVIVSVLQSRTGNKLSGDDRIKIVTVLPEEAFISEGSWMFGLMTSAIPGIIGLIAAFTQNKCMYETTIFVTFFSLVIMSTFIVLYGLFLIVVVSASKIISDYCIDAAVNCTCRFHQDVYRATAFKTCADLDNYINEKYDHTIMTLLFAFLILTWLAELRELYLAHYYKFYLMVLYWLAPYGPPAMPVIMPPRRRILPGVPFFMPQAYGQPGSDVIYQATIKNQLTVIVRAKPVTDNGIDG